MLNVPGVTCKTRWLGQEGQRKVVWEQRRSGYIQDVFQRYNDKLGNILDMGSMRKKKIKNYSTIFGLINSQIRVTI